MNIYHIEIMVGQKNVLYLYHLLYKTEIHRLIYELGITKNLNRGLVENPSFRLDLKNQN